MKAISLWQPWATAVALGLKGYETRGWATKIRGPIAIHAAGRWSQEQLALSRRLESNGIPRYIPLGAIVATAELVEVFRVEDVLPGLSEIEQAWGDYSPGRFAWQFRNVRAMAEPLKFKGHQGFFHIPDELLRP